jgi:hypothetical protein
MKSRPILYSSLRHDVAQLHQFGFSPRELPKTVITISLTLPYTWFYNAQINPRFHWRFQNQKQKMSEMGYLHLVKRANRNKM